MLDETPFEALDLDLGRQLELDPAARLILRDGAGTIMRTLTRSDGGWNVAETGDGSITISLVEGVAVTNLEATRTSSIVYEKGSGVGPRIFANGTREAWQKASKRVWRFKNYKPVGDYQPPA